MSLRILDLCSPEFRRMKGNEIEMWNILKELDRIHVELMVPLVRMSRIKSYDHKPFRREMRMNFLIQRMVNVRICHL